MNFQKVYMNQVYSSCMMGQVAHLWRNQMLCDAVIKTGNTNTKAHRLMLIAACPMLQHMENASVGSHLEVRLSADIKQSSVTTFLQYLYEGFMMLTEENCKDVEKIGKLLHVDGVVKCCVNFYKCLQKNKGHQDGHFDFQEKIDSDHVHTLDLFNISQDNLYKRSADDYSSGSNKRPRSSFTSTTNQNDNLNHDTDDRQSMTQSYSSTHSSYENTKNRHRKKSLNSAQGVIELFEDSVEVVCTEPRERDSDGWPRESNLPPVQRRMSVSVSSKNPSDDAVQIINVSNASSPQIASEIGSNISSARNTPDNIGQSFSVPNNQNMPRIDLISSSLENQSNLSFQSGPNWFDVSSHRASGVSGRSDIVASKQERTSNMQTQASSHTSRVQHKSPTAQRSSTSPYTEIRVSHQLKSFAAGSAVQVSVPQSTATEVSSLVSKDTTVQKGHQLYTSSHVTSSQHNVDVSTKPSSAEKSSFMSKEEQIPDISAIIKIEDSSDTGGLDMSVDAHDNDKVEDEIKESISLEEAGDFFIDNSIPEDGSSYTDGEPPQESLPIVIDMAITSSPVSFQHQPDSIQCKFCFLSFPDKESRMQHYVEVKNHGYCFACKECGKGFKTQKGYEMHQKIQHTDLDDGIKCEVCGKKFLSKTFLKEHMISHSNVRAYSCSKCSKTFKHRHHLLRHARKCVSNSRYVSLSSSWTEETSKFYRT